jgi:hypothetical protein
VARADHTAAHSNAPRAGCRREQVEIAALVLFGSIALWFAEELNDNQL